LQRVQRLLKKQLRQSAMHLNAQYLDEVHVRVVRLFRNLSQKQHMKF
jgi:hypothetical protein